MRKRKIHFIGFLANVGDSILKLKLKDDFETKKLTQQEVMPFLRRIEFHYGVDTGARIMEFRPDGTPSGSYCITKQPAAEFEGTPQGGVVIKWGELGRFVSPLIDRIRLLRLFKEGNIVLWFSCFYYMKNTEPSVVSILREGPINDMTEYKLNDNEISDARSFIKNTKITFEQAFVQLAFKSFELSYNTNNLGLAFLSLMISLETMLNPSDHELRYRVSRNTAILLGQDKEESEAIFKDVKKSYDTRSKLIHTGQSKEVIKDNVLKLRHYVRESIKEINLINKSKEKLADMLNSCGFGQRPWRE